MDIDNNKMEEALAEILGISLDTVDALNLTIEENIGHDDFLYGYYVEFPQKENMDKDLLSEIESQDLDKIPWGETKYYSESEFSNTSVDPFGYRAEWEYEMFLQKHIPSKENIISQLKEIQKNLTTYSENTIITKSLILSAFSITESFVRSLLWKEIEPIDESNLKDELKTFIKKLFSKSLTRANDRIEIYKDLKGETLKPIPNIQVRNSLAHDMFAAQIECDMLVIKNKKDEEEYFNINNLITDLIKYINNPTSSKI